jgi:hypothetical protein
MTEKYYTKDMINNDEAGENGCIKEFTYHFLLCAPATWWGKDGRV